MILLQSFLCAIAKTIFLLAIFLLSDFAQAQATNANENIKPKSQGAVWAPDNGDGTYKNPILYADYSDPDVVRVGDDFYLTASSFSNFPGLPILHSKDLVNWEIIGHAAIQYPIETFIKPQHGNGIWAPSLRYHNGEFYIYFGDPDYGIFMTKTKNPTGPWEPLKLIRKAKGWIDPCPLWDDDGSAYLVHAWARSRSGIKHILTLNKMNAEGTKILDDGVTVFCDSVKHPTMEGPKLYKRNGYYYIFAPAGGVKPGWQVVLKSKNIYGPYEDRIVLEQGSTNINGPHQGGWIETQTGEDWFIHFQDRYAYGRIVHLQPMKWENDWPAIGVDYDKNGIGEPVSSYKKPNIGKKYPVCNPATNDEFNSAKLGLQWQWQANYNSEWISLKAKKGSLRFYTQPQLPSQKNLFNAAALLLQKFPAPQFIATTKVFLSAKHPGDRAGLIVFGLDYAHVGIIKTETGFKVSQFSCKDADDGTGEEEIDFAVVDNSTINLRVEINSENVAEIIPRLLCSFSYSLDGKSFKRIGKEFIAREGKWVGAKIGIFTTTNRENNQNSFADFDWFRFE
ncbi:MAG: glycoside hydrolase 43 family protein [Ignavibacteria bacterium]|nr:glycoside hydrolase 43 family protein [Ignavibacteria bacterium]